MSHFTVLVIGDGDIEKKLYPYRELDLPAARLKRDPRAVFNFRVAVADVPQFLQQEIGGENIEKYGYQKRIDSGDLDGLMYDWDGMVRHGDSYGYFDNPNAKWDWYTVGGRWTGKLKLKHGASGEVGRPGLMTPGAQDGYVDSAALGDVDWDAMQNDRVKTERHTRLWEIVVDGFEPVDEDEKYLRHYNRQYYLDRYGTKKRYVELEQKFTTWAVITQDGKWHEQGRMGWFAASDETHDEAVAWKERYWDTFLADLDPGTLITIVDCHI